MSSFRLIYVREEEEEDKEEEEKEEEKMTFITLFDDSTTTTKTAYERERDERVRRNEAVMRRLGLHSFDVRAHHFSNNKKEKKKRKKLQKPTLTVGGVGTRRTKRLIQPAHLLLK